MLIHLSFFPESGSYTVLINKLRQEFLHTTPPTHLQHYLAEMETTLELCNKATFNKSKINDKEEKSSIKWNFGPSWFWMRIVILLLLVFVLIIVYYLIKPWKFFLNDAIF
jgi:hypothetical protein